MSDKSQDNKSTDNKLSDDKSTDDPESQVNQNVEILALQNIGKSDIQVEKIYTDNSAAHDVDHQETVNYIIFTDSVGPYQIFSPYYTGKFFDGFQYPNLIGYYYVKLIYSLGNIVKESNDVITLRARKSGKLLMPMNKAHRFIMIPECHNVNAECDQFDMKNYITDFSPFPEIIQEIENRNKVLLLEAALRAKFDRNHSLQMV